MFDNMFGPKKRKRTLTAADKKRIAAKQGWKCRRCGKPLPARFHIDHIKEFSAGGSDRESNLQALCPNCHAEKTEEDRHKKKQRKIREKEEESDSIFGGPNLFGSTPRKGKSNDLFGADNLFGPPPKKRKKKKQKSPFDLGF